MSSLFFGNHSLASVSCCHSCNTEKAISVYVPFQFALYQHRIDTDARCRYIRSDGEVGFMK